MKNRKGADLYTRGVRLCAFRPNSLAPWRVVYLLLFAWNLKTFSVIYIGIKFPSGLLTKTRPYKRYMRGGMIALRKEAKGK